MRFEQLNPDMLGLVLQWMTDQALKAANIALIIFLALVAYQVLTRLVQRWLTHIIRPQTVHRARLESKARTTARIARDIVKYTIILLATFMILRQVGLDLTPVLATISIVGIAISFGAQAMVRDILTGLSLFIEDQLNMGDFVEIVSVPGAVGIVEEFGLRATRIRDIHGDLHFVPNGQIGAINHFHRGILTYYVDLSYPPTTSAADLAAIRAAVDDFARQIVAQVPLIVGPIPPATVDPDAGFVRLIVHVIPTAGWFVEKNFVARLRAVLESALPEVDLGDPIAYRVSPELLAYRHRFVGDAIPTVQVSDGHDN